MQDSLPTPLTDDRFLFLRYRAANPNAKNKEADDYKAKIVSNDSEINIFDVPDNSFLKDAKLDLNDIQPFVEYSKGVAVFDLEWVGADGGEAKGDGTDIIVAIGIKNRGEYHVGCRKDRTEKQLLEWFYKQLAALKHVHTLAGHGAYGFFRKGEQVLVDFGMIWKRSIVNGLEKLCPWKPATGKWSTHIWRNAIVNGQPLEVPAWECRKYQLIDTYPQTALYDFLVSKLSSYSLKEAPVQFGIKDADERKHDIGADVYKYWAAGDTETIVEYLKEDLDDTELLFNYLLPQKYFMKSYMDWDLKRITTTGTGSWWLQYYKKETESNIPRVDKCGYKGALTYYKAGVYKNCCKFDYSGLYPSIMLTYLISMKWDKDLFLLKALKFLITYRKSIKKTQAFIDYDNGIETSEGIDAYGKQLTAKILANSLYGALALVDPYAAAAVTAYGRQLVRYMVEWLDERGVGVHGCFAAGTKVLTSEGDKTIESLLGKTTYVLNRDRNWVPVEFRSYGFQKIYNLKLKKGNKELLIRTTGNHRWLLESGNIKTTVELSTKDSVRPSPYKNDSSPRFDRIENNLCDRPETDNPEYRLGVVHGIVYGDGQRRSDNRNINEGANSVHQYGHFIQLCEDKRYLYEELEKSAYDGSITLYAPIEENTKCESFRITLRSDILLKELPKTKSHSYLLGFIRGLMATDGSVSGKDGCPDISGQKDTIEFLNEISWLVGIEPTRINISNKAGRITEIRGKQCIQKQDTYRIFFSKNSMVADDFLRKFHQDKWVNNLTGRSKAKWTIDSIEITDDFEEVFCCEEPITHTFTLTNGVICGNCDTDGVLASFKEDNFATDEERSNAFKQLEKELNEALPGETKVEYEEYIPMVYIPPNDKKKAAEELADKLNSMECYEVDPTNLDPGLSKNYIYFVKKGDKFKKIYKGKFKKRGKSWLQAGFVMDFIEKKFYEGDEAAKEFAIRVRDAIAQGTLDIKKVRETKLVSKSQKVLPMYGFENSQKYTLHYIWAGEIIKRRHEWKLIMPTDDETKPYDSDYYLSEFNEKILPQLFVDLPPIPDPMRTELSKDPETVERLLIKNGLF